MKRNLSLILVLTLMLGILTTVWAQEINVTLGEDTTYNTATGAPTPYGTFYKNHRQQYLITADELFDLGAGPGNITALAFNVFAVNNCSEMPNFRIRLKHTTQTVLTTTFEAGEYQQVWHHPNFLPVEGWNNHIFDAPFNWDGASNILVDVVYSLIPGDWTQHASVYFTATTGWNTSLRYQSDSIEADTATTGTLSVNRANMMFSLQALAPDFDNDMAAIAISGPNNANVGLPAAFTVTVRNAGANVQNNYTVKLMKEGGVELASQAVTTSLAFFEQTDVELTWTPVELEETYVYGKVVLTGDQNPANDETANHNVLVVGDPLVGTYEINHDGTGDYSSFSVAVDYMMLAGISGPVVFEIAPGIYEEQFTIGEIPGASPVNTITFTGVENTRQDAILFYEDTVTDARHIVKLDGAQHVRFNNLTFTIGEDAGFGFGIHIQNGAEDIEITNCEFNSIVTTSTNFVHIVSSDSNFWTGVGSSNNIVVSGNVFNDGYAALRINGAVGVWEPGIEVTDNVVNDAYYHGLYLRYLDAPIVEGNLINIRSETPTTTFGSGIYLDQINGPFLISKNDINNPGQYGIYLSNGQTDPTDRSRIVNNSVGGGFRNTGTFGGGIRILGTVTNLDIFYNSFNIDFGNGAGLNIRVNTATGLDIRNNSFAYTGGGTGYAIYLNSTELAPLALDYNNYYSNGSNFVYYGVDIPDLVGLQAVGVPAGNDQNSQQGDPGYTDVTNLDPLGVQLFAAGTPIPGIEDDIVGNLRDTENPSIGAYEITPSGADLAAVSISGPGFAPAGTELSYDITILNAGLQTQSNYTVRLMQEDPNVELASVVVTEPLDSGVSVVHTLNWTPVAGDYYIYGEVDVAGDENPDNDQTDIHFVRVLEPLIVDGANPYFEDFEIGDGGWTSGAIAGADHWELGTPNQTNINTAYSGVNAWMTYLNANYDNNANTWLMSPIFDFSNLSNPNFSVWLNIWSEAGFDAMILESSIDGGATWVHVIGDDDFYNNTSTSGPIPPPKWSGRTAGVHGIWTQFSTTLPALANQESVLLRFRFGSDGSVIDEGIALDDISIWEPVATELAVTPASAHFSATAGGESLPTIFTLTNVGIGLLEIEAGDIVFTGEDGDDFYLDDVTFPIEIGAGLSSEIGVIFAPDEGGAKTATMVITHSGVNSPYDIPLTGFAYPEGTVIFGTGEDVNTTTTGAPINIYFRSLRGQMIYHAAELTAAGIEAGDWLTHFGFYITQEPLYELPNFRIRMAHTAAVDVSEHIDITADNNVYFNTSYMPEEGDWDVLELDTPFAWNGVDNILVDTGFAQVTAWNSSGQQRIYNEPNGFRFIRQDAQDVSEMATTTVSTNKPQALMIFSEPPEIAGIGGTVTLVGGTGSVTDVEVTAGGITVNPNANGDYLIEIYPGTYDVTASLMGYQTETVTGVVVLDGVVTDDVDFALGNIEISVNPTALAEEVEQGTIVTVPLTITNDGAGDLEFAISVDYHTDELRSFVNLPGREQVNNNTNRARLHDPSFDEKAPLSFDTAQDYRSFIRDLFDLIDHFDVGVGGGEYSVATDGQYIYTAAWNSSNFYRYELDGTYLNSFTIPGAGNLRDLTYDGQYFYGSPNSGVIYQMDFTNQTLVSQITTSVSNIRGIAYDAVNDGFWVTQAWTGPLRLISRTGTTVQTLTTTVGSMSGLGWDGVTDGGPYLWAYTQPASNNILNQINLTTGASIQTFDVGTLGIIGADSISGGMDITNLLVPGYWTFIGTSQNDIIWILELLQDGDLWLDLDPISGTVPAGQSLVIDVTFDATDLEIGLYEADIIISNNAQEDPVTVPVAMTVYGDVIDPNPTVAHSPIPADEATNVALDTAIGWTYTSNPNYSDPIGFRVNMWVGDTTGDPYQAYVEGGPGEYYFEEHPFVFDYETEYFWQVIPTTDPDVVRAADNRTRGARREAMIRGDAENCPIWSFTTLEETEPVVLPPTNLTAVIEGEDNVRLNWEAPEFGDWIHWDDGVNFNAIGTGGAAVFKAAVRFSPDHLADFEVVGSYLTMVRFYPFQAAATYAINVWTGGTPTQPGDLVVDQAVPSPQIDAWNLVELDNPVFIDGTQELWIGYHVDTTTGHPAGCDAGPALDGIGNMMYFNNEWTTLLELAPTLDYNWNIQGFAAFAPGREVIPFAQTLRSDYTGIDHNNYVASGELQLSPQSNYNPAPLLLTRQGLTGYRIYRDGVAIAETDEDVTTYLDEQLEPDVYEYYVTALYDDEESEPSNTVVINTMVSTLLFDDFESYDDFVLQFPPWTTIDLDGSDTYGFTDIDFPNSGSPMAYIIFNPSQTTPPMDLEAFSGDKMAASFAAVTPPNNDWMITPQLELGDNSTLTFWARSYTSQYGLERMKVGVSTQSMLPTTFTFISEDPYIEVPVEWTQYHFDLSDYDNQDIWLAINCVSHDAFILFIEDFHVQSIIDASVEDQFVTPMATQLRGNYPNPFNPETTISFDLQQEGPVTIEVFNIRGQKVATVVDDYLEAGNHRVVWDGRTDRNRDAGSGIYFYRMKAGSYSSTKKMILMK